MLKGKKLAQMFRTDNRILVKRLEEGYWLSNTYVLVRVGNKEGSKFIGKWNDYKTTDFIPHLNPGDTYEISSRRTRMVEDSDPLGDLIKSIDKDSLQKVTITELSKISGDESRRIYRCGDRLGLYSNKYQFIIEELKPSEIKAEGLLSPLVLLDKNEDVMGLIMPLRADEDEIKEKLKKIAS
ncbi:hypothetical protein [Halarsenatibacter silvermanii]|uniref:Uncharacterized protein n=1 Tax=Halarsenatibacter silvermanii TaxID=321763 RepID=A0A1G9RW09_9FIRM|nr:hypothetical protein [Halarsenatibacter silvermanii]SDM27197.1 hypothetical protein SAMN04488692_12421 [Halarsenatibacter silvermanii]